MIKLARAGTSIKTVRGKQIAAAPFVGYRDSEVVVGLDYGGSKKKPEGSLTWGLLSPVLPITCWRAMRVLELLDIVENTTLAHCFYAARGEESDGQMDGARKVIETIGKRTVSEILNRVPGDNFIAALLSHGILSSEILQEVEAGRLSRSGTIDAYLEVYARELKRQAREAQGWYARVETAEDGMRGMGSRTISAFLDTYLGAVAQSSLLAIRHTPSGVSKWILVGRSAAESGLRLALEAAYVDTGLNVGMLLRLSVFADDSLPAQVREQEGVPNRLEAPEWIAALTEPDANIYPVACGGEDRAEYSIEENADPRVGILVSRLIETIHERLRI